MKSMLVALTVSMVAAGCAPTVEYRYLSSEPLKNAQGHVIGHKERLQDPISGERFEQVTMYEPLRDEKGDIYAYQEPIRGGMQIRGLDGRRIGARYTDLRSRGSNPGTGGVQIIFLGKDEKPQ